MNNFLIYLFASPVLMATLVVVVMSLAMLVKYIQKQKREKLFKEYFKAKSNFFAGVEFDFAGAHFLVEELASGGEGLLHKYAVLETRVDVDFPFTCGNGGLTAYAFRIPKVRKQFYVGGKELLVATPDEATSARFESAITAGGEHPVHKLFEKKYCFMEVKQRVVFGRGSYVSNQYVLRYYGLTHDIYTDPSSIERVINQLLPLLESAGVKLHSI